MFIDHLIFDQHFFIGLQDHFFIRLGVQVTSKEPRINAVSVVLSAG
jgi:hypothetical protein